MSWLRRSWNWRGLPAVHILAAVVLAAPSAHALDPARQITQYIQTSWTSDSGLPQNSVHAIAQTTDGYLWFGTEEGLARFDGMHYTVYSRENSSVASDYIQALKAGPHGSLWIGTDSGLSYYQPVATNPASGTFQTFTTKDGLSSDRITAFCAAADGALWVGTSRGLDRIVNGRIEDWTAGKGLVNAAVNTLAFDSGGTLWVGTAKGLWRLTHGGFVAVSSPGALAGDDITALASAADGTLWVGTLTHGLAEIRQGRAFIIAGTLPSEQIDGLLADHDGVLWVAFDRHGIGRLDRGKLDLYNASIGLPSNRTTRALFEDREGSLWIGMDDAGVVQLRNGKFSVFGKPEGLSGNYIGNLLQAHDGTMWISADSNGLDHLLPDGRVEVWDRRRGLPNDAVYSLLQARDGSLWIGYKNDTLAHVKSRRIAIYHDPQAKNSSMNSLFQDQQGRIWVGYYGEGLAQFQNGEFRHVTRAERVVDIAQTPDGTLWIATDGDGVERLAGGVLTRITTADGLPNNHVICLYVDGEDSVWVGMASGNLSRIRAGHIDSWSYRQGLPASTIGSIVGDNFGNLWMGSDAGIFRIPEQELASSAGKPDAKLHPVLYGTEDGLRSRETVYGSMPSAWKDTSGRLWFATIDGAAVINPAHIPVDRIAPPVWIESVKFDSRPIALENGIRLGPGSGNVQITFAAPSFVAPDKVRFRYRLSGFDSEWTDADARRSVWYTNLPPGAYTFQVQAENSDGIWNRTGASFSFVVLAPLTHAPLAYLLYGLAAILLVWGAIAFRTRHLTRRQLELTRRQLELTRTVAERTAQLEAEKRELEETRRQLHIQATHDSLTGLYNRGAMIDHLEREIARAQREGTALGVIIADLDHFKRVNDQYGHLCGDDIIREAAGRLRAATRSYDIVGRYGGEEFLILLPNFDLRTGRIDHLLEAIRDRPFEALSSMLHITCSVGVGTFRPDIDSPDLRDVIGRADAALYAAKDAGRNCVRYEHRWSGTAQIEAEESMAVPGDGD